MDILMNGPHTVVVLNGVKVTDYREADAVPERKLDFEPVRGPRPDGGWIGLQAYSRNGVVCSSARPSDCCHGKRPSDLGVG